jgi:hypothetical protein
MSLDEAKNKKLSGNKKAIRTAINNSIYDMVRTDEAKDATVTLGSWGSGAGKREVPLELRRSIRGADQFHVLDVVSDKETIPSPAYLRRRFGEWTSDWANEGNDIRPDDAATWPQEVLDWANEKEEENDRAGRRSKYGNWLKRELKEADMLPAGRGEKIYSPTEERKGAPLGASLMQQRITTTPLDVPSRAPEAPASSVDEVRTLLQGIKAPNDKLERLKKEIRKASGAPVQTDLKTLYESLYEVIHNATVWEQSIRLYHETEKVSEAGSGPGATSELMDAAEQNLDAMAEAGIEAVERLVKGKVDARKLNKILSGFRARKEKDREEARALARERYETDDEDLLRSSLSNMDEDLVPIAREAIEQIHVWLHDKLVDLGVEAD